jgi:hypothetical protein
MSFLKSGAKVTLPRWSETAWSCDYNWPRKQMSRFLHLFMINKIVLQCTMYNIPFYTPYRNSENGEYWKFRFHLCQAQLKLNLVVVVTVFSVRDNKGHRKYPDHRR